MPRMKRTQHIAGAALLISFILCAQAPARAELTRSWSGNEADVKTKLHGPALILDGGGGGETPASQDAIDMIRGCKDCDAKVDVVVIRASGAEGDNPSFMKLTGVDSVLSLVITDRDSANQKDIVQAVRNAEVVFFAGEDPCSYIRWIKGTGVDDAVKSVYKRGGAVGGSSAGMSIQGQIVYDSCPNQSARSSDVLMNPYHEDVSLSQGFFNWPPLRGTIIDTHFKVRDRMGRLLVFLARSMQDESNRRVVGLGVNEGTVLLLDGNGRGVVYGDGPVNVVLAGRKAKVIDANRPLTSKGFKIWRFDKGATVDLRRLPKDGYKTIDVVEGKLSGDPY